MSDNDECHFAGTTVVLVLVVVVVVVVVVVAAVVVVVAYSCLGVDFRCLSALWCV